MKVLFVIDSLAGGGAERSLVELLAPLSERGIDPSIVVLEDRGGALAEDAVRAGATVTWASGSRDAFRISGVRDAIRETDPDIVHTTLVRSDVVGRLAARTTPARVVTSLVNTTYDPARRSSASFSRVKLEAVRRLDGWTARHLTDRFHAISQAVKDSAVRALKIDADLVTVIPRGRDLGRLGLASADRRRRERARLGLADDAELLLAVGRQDLQKGHPDLLVAFDLIAGKRPRARLLIAGKEGSATASLVSHLRTSPNAGRVRLLGERDDVPALLAAADVFVFPSHYEGLGGSLLEAMALEVPIVASDLPSSREVLGTADDVFVAPGDAPSLARAVIRALDDARWARDVASRHRARSRERFSLATSADRLAQLYAAVVRQSDIASTSP